MNYSEIEKVSRDLLGEIWRKRKKLWLGYVPEPLKMLDPEIAAKVLGITYLEFDDLGRFGNGKDRFEIAGMLNRPTKEIAVSNKFPSTAMRFTGAHEVGHWVLHPNNVMHRDRPIKGVSDNRSSRPQHEREADYFAACFLVPERLAVEEFRKRFGKEPLRMDDHTAFYFCNGNPGYMLRNNSDSLEFPLAVASARTNGHYHFDSLAEYFRVSSTTMAIRLLELGLVRVD